MGSSKGNARCEAECQRLEMHVVSDDGPVTLYDMETKMKVEAVCLFQWDQTLEWMYKSFNGAIIGYICI